MGSEVIFEGISFPTTLMPPSSTKSLVLVGNGITDTEIHFLQIKFTAIGVYAEPEIASHLQPWKGKSISELTAEESGFFSGLCKAPVEKFIEVVIIKEVKGSQYVGLLQSSVRDRLAIVDKYEEEEEEALDKFVLYFQTKSWMTQGTTIFYYWASASTLQVAVSSDGTLPLKFEHTIENENVAKCILEWIVGERSISPSLQTSVAGGVGRLQGEKIELETATTKVDKTKAANMVPSLAEALF